MSKKVAAIDVGSEKMHVGIPGRQPKIFDCFTDSLHRLRDYLKAEEVGSVAMEATGVYWLPVFTILEEAGLEVVVINGAHVKNVPGRKTDLQDCQWLAQLHAQGLLRGGFVPPAQIRKLRQYVRLRQDHVRSGAQHILHMQKALDLMNIKIHDVLSETVGVSCLAHDSSDRGRRAQSHGAVGALRRRCRAAQNRTPVARLARDLGSRASVQPQASSGCLGLLSGTDCRLRCGNRKDTQRIGSAEAGAAAWGGAHDEEAPA